MNKLEQIEGLLKKYKQVKFDTIFTYSEMEERYRMYAEMIKERKGRIGISSLDNALGGIRPGQICTFIGSTNTGKTAAAMHIIRANAKVMTDRIALLFSLETTETELFERTLQSECDLTTYDVERAYQTNNTEQIEKFQGVINSFSNIISVVKRISVDEIIPYVKVIEVLYQKPVGVIALDWLGLTGYENMRDEYQRTTEVMKALKGIMVQLKVPLFLFSQVPRADAKDKKIGLHSGKGSGEIENSSQIVITLQEEGEPVQLHDRQIRTIRACIRKKKQGAYAETILQLDLKSLKISEENRLDADLTDDADKKERDSRRGAEAQRRSGLSQRHNGTKRKE